MSEPEKKKVNPLGLIATGLASITSMLIGSVIKGFAGALIGTGILSAVSAIAVVLYENAAIRARERLKGRHKRPGEDEISTRLFPAIKVKKSRRPYLLAVTGLLTAGVAAVAALGVLGLVKGFTGTTLGDYTPAPSPRVTVVITTPPATLLPTLTGSPVPLPSPVKTHSPSPSPSATLSPTPSPSPDGSPTLGF